MTSNSARPDMRSNWNPADLPAAGPRYLALVQALESDVLAGRIPAGTRLPPQRDLADQLGLSLGTVSRAYALAAHRGLIDGEVGRGTFVRARPAEGAESRFFGDGAGVNGSIDLSLNVPPIVGEADRLCAALRSLATAPNVLEDLMKYLPHQGLGRHRYLVAEWIARSGFRGPVESTVLCHGAQHALHVALSCCARSGDTALVESATYPGFRAAARDLGIKLKGVAMDDEGLIPEALDEACQRTDARILFTMPTLQNPTTVTMPAKRRELIAAVARKRGLHVIEDDVYGFLLPDAPSPIATYLPEQTFYVGSFSKCLNPGLRLGFVVAPRSRAEQVIAAVRASAWMACPISAEIVARWVGDGTVAKTGEAKRIEALRRLTIATKHLGRARLEPLCGQASFHLWLRLPGPEDALTVAARCASQGVIVTPPDAVSAGPEPASGIRICLGAPGNDQQLDRGLVVLAAALQGQPGTDAISIV